MLNTVIVSSILVSILSFIWGIINLFVSASQKEPALAEKFLLMSVVFLLICLISAKFAVFLVNEFWEE